MARELAFNQKYEATVRELRDLQTRLDAAARYVLDLNKRLVAVEKRVSPGQPISEEQAERVLRDVDETG